MEEIVLFLVIGIVALAIGVLVGYMLRKIIGEKSIGSAEMKARNLILDAENKGKTIKKEIEIEAKEKAHKLREKVENEAKEQRIEFKRLENRLMQKEESIDKKLANIEEKEENLQRKEQSITDRKRQVEEVHQKQLEELQRISGYSIDQAKDVLLEECKSEVTQEASQLIKDIEGKAREEAEKNAKEIIVNAVQRCAADHIAETTVSVVNLPNDEMKGRIIGREGRNIRAIETATGIDIIIDDTPEAIILSGFDPVRREVARLAIEKLIVDGRIHPAKIEEVVLKSQKEVENIIKEAGEQATYEVGIHNLHPALVKLMGRMKYRTSYGQNVLKHSIEVAHLAGLMATELGCDVNLAKRAGFLHDIGKAVDHEVEGTHVEIGIDLLKKYKESYAVIDGMKSHHGDYEHASLEAVIVTAADALSAARPGARRETLEKYIKRLKSLEKIANTTPGVEKSFAIQAGREIRIIANPDKTDDKGIEYLARDIAKKIEAELQYPGEIKVNVIRETRAVEHAR